MATYTVEHEEVSLVSTLLSNNDLREVFSVSPSVVSLLPAVMRAMADEIESASRTGEAHNSPTDPSKAPDPVDVHSVAQQVASALSVTLSRHLPRSLCSEASGPADVPPHLRSVPPGEKSEQTGERASDSGAAPRHLRLKVLGSPEIAVDGVRLKILERCNRASLVLYILALHPGGLSGERLAASIASDSTYLDAFDSDANLAMGAIRTFIWRLRKHARWRGIVVCSVEQGGYQSRYRLPDDTTCDLWDFESKLDEAARLSVRAHMEPEAADRAAAVRQDAILLYKGEFCKGIGAGALSQAAEYLHNRYLQAVLLQASYWKDKATALQQARQKSGLAGRASVQEESAWLEALGNYRLAAQVEPYDEAAYAGAMLCQAHLGQSMGIHKTLTRCSQVLKSELDTKLQPTTIRTGRECLRIASQVSSIAHPV